MLITWVMTRFTDSVAVGSAETTGAPTNRNSMLKPVILTQAPREVVNSDMCLMTAPSMMNAATFTLDVAERPLDLCLNVCNHTINLLHARGLRCDQTITGPWLFGNFFSKAPRIATLSV